MSQLSEAAFRSKPEPKAAVSLSGIFPGSNQVRLLRMEQADDRRIWHVAGRKNFTVVSLDADFAELAQTLGPPPKVIWLRCGNQPTQTVATVLRRHSAAIKAFGGNDDLACLELYLDI